MLAYYISQSNEYTFRTEPTASNLYTMGLQDMFTLESTTMSLSGVTYNGYESMLSFTGSISGAYEGAEYRATLYNTGAPATGIWNGTVQVYQSQSIDKAVYENQIPPVTSHDSENRYVILK